MKKFFILITAAAAFSLMACNDLPKGENQVYTNTEEMVEAAKAGVEAVSPNDFKGMMDAMEYFYLIDVRSEDEFAAGYIPSAVSIPRGVLEFRIASEAIWDKEGLYMPTPEDMLIVYCKVGQRSILAAQTLKQLGFTNVKYIDGGWTKWHELFPAIQEKLVVEAAAMGGAVSAPSTGGGC